MRTGCCMILVLALLEGSAFPVRAQTQPWPSRVENRSRRACRVAMGQWVAGEIRLRQPKGKAELARLKGEGETYPLAPGQSLEMLVLPTHDSLALQVVFLPGDGSGLPGSVFISQGNPGDPPTLNINEAPAVQVEKARFGRPEQGPFVLIH